MSEEPPEWRAIEHVLDPGQPGDGESGMWGVTVAWRGPGDQWAVIRGCYMSGNLPCFDADGEMDYEPSPSNRTDEWKATHRFTLDEAFALGERVLPTIRINGMSWRELVRWREAGHPRDDNGRVVIPPAGVKP